MDRGVVAINAVSVGDGGRASDDHAHHAGCRELQASEEQFRLLAQNCADVLLQTIDGTLVWASPALSPTLGWRPEEWVGHCLEDFTHPEDVGRLQMMRADVGQGHTSLFRIRVHDRAGELRWIEVHAGPNLTAEGRNIGMVATLRAVDDQVEAERQWEHLARFDALTGLMNRAQALQAVEEVMEQTPRTGSRIALLFCDLDRFKVINDEYGHRVGDAVLRAMGERIRECIRADDFAARIGGDEFLVVLTGLHDEAEAMVIAEKIRSAADRAVAFNPVGLIRSGMSIGVAVARPGETGDRLIERADTAMYRAKRAGRNLVSA